MGDMPFKAPALTHLTREEREALLMDICKVLWDVSTASGEGWDPNKRHVHAEDALADIEKAFHDRNIAPEPVVKTCKIINLSDVIPRDQIQAFRGRFGCGLEWVEGNIALWEAIEPIRIDNGLLAEVDVLNLAG